MLDLLNLYQFSKQILALHLCRFFVFSKTFIISDMGAISLKPFSFLGVCDLGIGMMFEVFPKYWCLATFNGHLKWFFQHNNWQQFNFWISLSSSFLLPISIGYGFWITRILMCLKRMFHCTWDFVLSVKIHISKPEVRVKTEPGNPELHILT